MEESILTNTKKSLGLDEGYDAFDQAIIMFINSTLSTLEQLGVGVSGGLSITGPEEIWADLEVSATYLGMVKTYIFLKVRMLFDPPSTGFLVTAMNSQVEEFEYRLRTFKETEIV